MAIVVTLLVAAGMAVAQVAPPKGAARPAQAPPPPPAVATVGALRITQTELDQRVQQALAEYKGRTTTEVPPEVMPIVRRQILEGLIRRDLLVLEARRRGLQATEQEAEAQLQKDPFFQVNGKFDAARFNQVRLQNPAVFASAIQTLRTSLAAQKLMRQLQAEKGPSEATLRARARRELMRVDVDYLAVRRSEFDGNYPEPRESEILDYYRGHAKEFERPQRALLSIVFVDQPALPDSEAAVPAEVTAWNARMKQRADSILAGVKAGRKLEELTAPFGGPRPNQIALPGNFPGFWGGNQAVNQSVFTAAPGTILPEAVPGQHGWLVARVDRVEPAHVAAFREVAREIRARLRNERRQGFEEQGLRALYETLRDSLKTTGYRLRYAVVDSASIDPGQPGPADLDRYYRAHLADYSSFSSQQGGVTTKPFAEVRDDVQARWLRERRAELARSRAEDLRDAWTRGKRDPALEQRLRVREAGPLPLGVPVDSSVAGRLIADSLAARAGATDPGLARSGDTWAVFQVLARVPDYVPSFAQARPRLVERFRARRQAEDEDGARKLFEASPREFQSGNVVHYSRVMVAPPSVLRVPLTHGEVERYYREHIEKYSAAELVSAQHILISPRDRTAAADREARARADSILAVLRAGADFATVAGQTTDDPATRENGGDLGTFGRGAMLPEFERAAFAMRAGDLSREPVRTSVGYHIIKVYDYRPLSTNPLAHVYSNVSSDAAEVKADSLNRVQADSLWRSLKSAAAARLAAKHMGLSISSYDHVIGQQERAPQDVQPYFRRLESVKAGAMYPGIQQFKGMGFAVTWVDSVTPPRTPTWDEAREKAVEVYREGAGTRALNAKLAELDSLMQAGWTLDSLAAGWGGLVHSADYSPGTRLAGVGTSGLLDSLIFGSGRAAGLTPGRPSAWVRLPGGALRLRVGEVRSPDANAVTTRIETLRSSETEAALFGYFDVLKKRFPVRILDRKLRDAMLPQTVNPAR